MKRLCDIPYCDGTAEYGTDTGGNRTLWLCPVHFTKWNIAHGKHASLFATSLDLSLTEERRKRISNPTEEDKAIMKYLVEKGVLEYATYTGKPVCRPTENFSNLVVKAESNLATKGYLLSMGDMVKEGTRIAIIQSIPDIEKELVEKYSSVATPLVYIDRLQRQQDSEYDRYLPKNKEEAEEKIRRARRKPSPITSEKKCPNCQSSDVYMPGFSKKEESYQCEKCRHKWVEHRETSEGRMEKTAVEFDRSHETGRCPKCGTTVAEPTKKWKMAGRPDKTGKRTELEIGLFNCPKCRASFREVLRKTMVDLAGNIIEQDKNEVSQNSSIPLNFNFVDKARNDLGKEQNMDYSQPLNEDIKRLHQDRTALSQMIARYQTDLAGVIRLLQISAVSIALGIFVLLLGLANTTLATMGESPYTLDLLTCEALGILMILIGIILLSMAIYVKINYPTRLAGLTQSLNDLDDLLKHEKVFPQSFRNTLSHPYHAHFEDYIKKRQALERRVQKMMSFQPLLRICKFPIALIGAALSIIVPALIQSPIRIEPIIVGGIAILLGTFWSLLNYRKHKNPSQPQR